MMTRQTWRQQPTRAKLTAPLEAQVLCVRSKRASARYLSACHVPRRRWSRDAAMRELRPSRSVDGELVGILQNAGPKPKVRRELIASCLDGCAQGSVGSPSERAGGESWAVTGSDSFCGAPDLAGLQTGSYRELLDGCAQGRGSADGLHRGLWGRARAEAADDTPPHDVVFKLPWCGAVQ